MGAGVHSEGIAATLRAATAVEHRDTESQTFITGLMGGTLTLDDYARYLAQYARVYRALEARGHVEGGPAFLNDARLFRAPAIEQDLVELGFPDWESRFPVYLATEVYCDRITATHPDIATYTAHHYTRYLGDLSGGQAIASRVAQHYGATESQLSFYRFERIERPVPFKRWYREQLDALPLCAEQVHAMVAEAKAAFVYNGNVFEALGADDSQVVEEYAPAQHSTPAQH